MVKRKANRRKQQVRRAPVTGNALIMQRILGIFLLCFIIVILGFFIANFFRGKPSYPPSAKSPTPISAPKSTNSPTQTAATQPSATLSTKPKYDFYQDLQKRNSEVQAELQKKIETAQNVKVNGKNYRIQIGAFQDKDGADRLRARMILRDYPVQVINNSKLYLVQIGPYLNRDEAETIQKKLKKEGVKDVVMKAYVN